MRIPFFKHEINITKRGVKFIDNKTQLPVEFDTWVNKFSLGGKTPILENIYDTISSEFSKIDLFLVEDILKEKDGEQEHVYKKLDNMPTYDVLSLRPNMLQTKSELLYTVAYQLHMYRNALVRIVRHEDFVIALEPLNVDDYLFGQGYEVGGSLYLKLKEKKSGKILLLDYSDTVHLRLNPNDIFFGDKNDTTDLTHFVKLFDENLSVLLNELKHSGKVNGILTVSGSVGGAGTFNGVLGTDEDKISKQDEVVDRIKATKEGILVLDDGEKWTSLSRTFETMSTDEVNNIMKYLYNFKGINQAVIDGTATEPQMEVFFNKTVMPIVERFVEELNYKILTEKQRKKGMKVEHFKNPFEYMATKDLLSSLYLGAMFFTQNEVRQMAFKLPPLKGGDTLVDNKNFTKSLNQARLTKGETAGGDDDAKDS